MHLPRLASIHSPRALTIGLLVFAPVSLLGQGLGSPNSVVVRQTPIMPAQMPMLQPAPVPMAEAAWDASASMNGTTPLMLSPADTATRGDHRWLGAAVGAAVLGITAGIGGYEVCRDPDNATSDCGAVGFELLLAGATVGAVTGGLLGMLFPKGGP
jgi:hypothetical protein